VIDVLTFPTPDPSTPPQPEDVERSRQLNAEGGQARDAGDLAAAERHYLAAIASAPGYAHAWFNLGLVYKAERDWIRTAVCNRRALELDASEGDPAYWNLGIAATALREWDTARWAWRGYGIAITGEAGPIEMDFGMAPVRINPDSAAEVVWGWRLDPARAVIANVPLPSSGHRWHDVVLHDGEPTGQRVVGDDVYGVFDEIEVWERSQMPTWECLVDAPADAIADLRARFDEHRCALEVWTDSIRELCRTCSMGSAAADHDHGAFRASAGGSHVGIAAPRALAERLLDEWSVQDSRRARSELVATE
jgi:tetratricopeptide (TPR) repeat protein